MKQTKTIIFICMSLLQLSAISQVRHVKGVHSVNVNYCRTFESSFGANIGYTRFLTNKFSLSPKYEFEKGTIDYTNYSIHTVNILPTFTLISAGKYYLSTYANTAFGYEKLLSPLEEYEEKWIFDVGVGFMNEFYIHPLFAINLSVTQNIYTNCLLGNRFISAEAGLKLILNNIKTSKKSLLNN